VNASGKPRTLFFILRYSRAAAYAITDLRTAAYHL
jgi:hypothetical protein